ncbi:uncharacterized protein B0P05DRAFT_551253 [Gilbertella persicaria]|uniref:uncharacterized protein n=1 Tax=Gilbertella persicaria TaxID=101096 RepID=UPI00221F0FB1|nr:uncharacterized protein B0P05DRAFT_551253 [Gilbertella persicaria]KAI8069019.1 hypothetical protein B0P05DRAFT_551253 [Gilbertella persicaria]
MYNNTRQEPDIFAILSQDDPVVDIQDAEHIDTDALVMDIFDTPYPWMGQDYTPGLTRQNNNTRRHSVAAVSGGMADFNFRMTHPTMMVAPPPPPPPPPSLLRSHLTTVMEGESHPYMGHRASMPNIFMSEEMPFMQKSSSISARTTPTNTPPPIQFNPMPWSQPPCRKRSYSTELDSFPMISSRRASVATPQDISTWHRMVDAHQPEPSQKRIRTQDEEDYPIITEADMEAAKKDPNAIPRRQKLRFDQDEYTPKWVRYTGQSKEGYCDTCQPGKWLQLKNSAFWYHKQFFHGISSVSGKPFEQPLQKHAGENDVIEGLCHQCKQFVPICNSKRKNSVLWFRHAHKCHIYDKPKTKQSQKRASMSIASPLQKIY